MPVLLGKDAKTYYSTTALDGDTNTSETVTWVEVSNIQDENDNWSAEEVDVTTRATAQIGWSQTIRTVKNAEVTFGILVQPGDPLFDLIRTAFYASSEVTMMFLSGADDAEGSFGIAANWSVSMSMAKPVKGVQTAEVSLKVSSSAENVTIET